MKRIVPLFLLWALIAGACAPLSFVSGGVTEEAYYDTEEPIIQPSGGPVGENGQIARQHLEALTDIGARWSGSGEEADARQYIVEAFDAMGYESDVQPFTAIGDDGDSVESANVVAVKNGDSTQVIVVGAHYDSSDEGLGSDDNASGVAVLLEAAALVKNESTPYTIDFVTFGAEEAGLLGSYAFVSSLDSGEANNIILFINLDSVAAGDITYVYSPENKPQARDWTINWANANGYDLQTIRNVNLSDQGDPTADYAAFEEAGIPWIYFEATNWTLGDQDGYTQVDPQYGDQGTIIHTQYDNLQYLDQTFPGRVDQHLDLFVSVLHHILTEYQP